ncbi:MAG: ScyD/ScyE family protein [Chthoniobacterales bacterium]|nr:ScyD/ScyE family protein [Chthoniobacterales bacterium]
MSGLLLMCLAASALAQSNVTVFATGLEYPRGLEFGPDRQLYVAEAGSGGNLSTDGLCDQVEPPVGPYTGGFTSRISKIDHNGTVTTVADNLPSSINALGDVLGIADVAFIGNTLYALSAGGGCSHGLAGTVASVLRVNADGSTTQVADLSTFQQTHPTLFPHEGPGFEPDGSWYSMLAVKGQLVALEPNHDELDSIQEDGRIRRILDISAFEGQHIDSTALAYDGNNFFVGNLGTFPIVDGTQVILKVSPSGQVKTFATGFTTILGLAFDSRKQLYVLENTTGGNEFPTPGTGKILRLHSDGTSDEIATGLNLPTAMTFGPDGNIYVSSWGFGPPGMGEIDKVTMP